MRTTHVVASALALLAAVAIVPAEAQNTFTARLDWVPIGGAERNDVSGGGSATATLSGSRLCDHGLVRGTACASHRAKLHQGVATGARGGPAIAELSVTATRGARCPATSLEPRATRRSKPGSSTYSVLRKACSRTTACCGAGCCRNELRVMNSNRSFAALQSLRPSPVALPRHRRSPSRRASRRRPRGLRAKLRHLPRPEPAPAAERAARRRRSSSAAGATARRTICIAQARSTMPPDNPGGLSGGNLRERRRVLAASRTAAPPSDERDRRGHDGARRPRPRRARAARRGRSRAAPSAPPAPTGVIVAGTVPSFTPVTDAMLRNPDAEDWLMLRHDYSATSYSPLTQITPENAHQLRLAWIWPMRDGGTNQPAPLVYDGTLYLANTGGIIQALDAKTGDLIWEHHVGAEIAPRGITLYRNMLIFQSAERVGRSAAGRAPHRARRTHGRDRLERRDAERLCDEQRPDRRERPADPGRGHVHGLREDKCSISAYDPETGEQRWLFRTIALDGEPGGDSWGGLPDLYRAGGEALDHRQLRSRSEPHVLGHRAGEAVDAREPRHARRTTSRSTRARRWRSNADDRRARMALRARARRSVRSRRRVRARARRRRRREVGVLGRQGRRALEARSRRPASTSGTSRDRVPERLGELRSRDRPAALSRRHPRAQGRRVDRRVPEHGRRQELARDELPRVRRAN